MKVLVLILTIMFPDGSLHTRVFQAPPEENIKHCKEVVLPQAVAKAKTQPYALQSSGICFEIHIDLEKT